MSLRMLGPPGHASTVWGAALLCFALATFALADEPRIKRISEQDRAAALAALQANLASNEMRTGALFADVVQCGPALWAAIEGRFRKHRPEVRSAAVVFSDQKRASAWGFRKVSLTDSDPTLRKALEILIEESPGSVPIEIGLFNAHHDKLGVEVSQKLASLRLPTVREATKEEMLYLWMLVPYDLEEPIFVIQSGATRVLVNLDKNNKIYWMDTLPFDV